MEEPVVDRDEAREREPLKVFVAVVPCRDAEQPDEREETDRDRLEPVDRRDRAEGPVLKEGERDRDPVREQEGEERGVGSVHERRLTAMLSAPPAGAFIYLRKRITAG